MSDQNLAEDQTEEVEVDLDIDPDALEVEVVDDTPEEDRNRPIRADDSEEDEDSDSDAKVKFVVDPAIRWRDEFWRADGSWQFNAKLDTAPYDADGERPIHAAAALGNEDAIKILVQKGIP